MSNFTDLGFLGSDRGFAALRRALDAIKADRTPFQPEVNPGLHPSVEPCFNCGLNPADEGWEGACSSDCLYDWLDRMRAFEQYETDNEPYL